MGFIEQKFQQDSMKWFTQNSNRFSPFHWKELYTQAIVTAQLLNESTYQISTPLIGVLGFGFGRETEVIQKSGFRGKIVGLDINASRFPETKAEKPDIFNDKFYPLAASMNNIPVANDTFHTTVCLETMMHSDSPFRTLQEMTRVTKPNGLIVFNISMDHGFLKKYFTILRNEGLLRTAIRVVQWIKQDNNNSLIRTKLYTETEVNKLIKNNTSTTLEHKNEYLNGFYNYIVLKKSE